MLLLATVALTGCRFAEHSRRAAIDAFASFVLDSVFQMQSKAPLKEKTAPAVNVPVVRVAATPVPPPEERHECLSSTEITNLPKLQPRIAVISLAPAVTEICRVRRVYIADVAKARVEARMALAELRAQRDLDVHIRRIVIISELPDPATL